MYNIYSMLIDILNINCNKKVNNKKLSKFIKIDYRNSHRQAKLSLKLYKSDQELQVLFEYI